MRRWSLAFIAAVSTIALSQIAFAADLPRKAPAYTPPPPPPVYSWTGFYIGANVGYGWGNSSATESAGDVASGNAGGIPFIGSASTSFDTNGWAGGLQVGYNWQFNPRWVAGLEADFDWSDIKGSSSVSANITSTGTAPIGIFNASQKVEWFGTVRARLGYLPTNDLLVYATGGFAYGKVNESADFGIVPINGIGVGINGVSFACSNPPGLIGLGEGPTCFAGSNSRTSVGWTVGGGAEYRFWQNWSLKLEYLYVNLGSSETFTISAPTPAPGTSPSVLNVSFDDAAFSLVRAGLNYRF
jgi:outer membrane immunogenic protein